MGFHVPISSINIPIDRKYHLIDTLKKLKVNACLLSQNLKNLQKTKETYY